MKYFCFQLASPYVFADFLEALRAYNRIRDLRVTCSYGSLCFSDESFLFRVKIVSLAYDI